VPSTASALTQPRAPGPAISQADHGLLEALVRLLMTAQGEIDRHINNRGGYAACLSANPCNRACLADFALSAM
jgi:hypothetical protein